MKEEPEFSVRLGVSPRKTTEIIVVGRPVKQLEMMASILRKVFACGGTVKAGKIILQGNHVDVVNKIMSKLL